MARPTSDKNASRYGPSAPAVAPAQRTRPGAKGKFAKSPKLYDPIPSTLSKARIALSPAEAVRILRTMQERITTILGGAWPSIGREDGHHLIDELEQVLDSAINVAFQADAKLLGDRRREAQQITRQTGESIFRSIDLLSSRSRKSDQFKRIWDNGITLIGAITGDEPRGRLQPKETTAPETSELEARVLALAGELRTVSKSERKRLLSLLGHEVGLSATFADAAIEKTKLLLPETAPKLWGPEARKEYSTAIAFLESVYAPWLRAGLNLTYIREIDRSLYQTLAKWYERHKDDMPQHLADFFQSRRSKRSIEVEEELKRFNIVEPTDAYERFPNDRKRADRLYQAALRRPVAGRKSPNYS